MVTQQMSRRLPPCSGNSVIERQGADVRVLLRPTATAISALVIAGLVGVAATLAPLLSFAAAAATSVLVMGGTGHPLSTPPDTIAYVQRYTSAAVNNYVSPASAAGHGIPGGPYNTVAVITPEKSTNIRDSIDRGLVALDACIGSSTCDFNEGIGSSAPSSSDTFVVFGFSQSAAIAMLEKRKLAAQYAVGEGPNVTFIVIGNARPNGGLVARDVGGVFTKLILGVLRSELVIDPAPTNTQYATVDTALQYDLLADAPLNPLNLLAVANAYMGMVLLHPNYADFSLTTPGVVDQGQYGDTHYYLIPADTLPLLMPLDGLGPLGHALADTLDPALRVIIESAYDRSTSPGVPTAWNATYFEDPITLARNVLDAIPVGLDNGIQDLWGVRPLRTKRPGAYGVGGTEVEVSAPATADASASGSSLGTDGGSSSRGSESPSSADKPGLAGSKRARPPILAATSSSKKSKNNSESSVSRKASQSSSHRGVGSSKRAS